MTYRTSILLVVALVASITASLAQSTAFTYQGYFQTNGVPYTGPVEFQFTLWDAPIEGTAIATNNPPSIVASADAGVFTVTVDFGSAAFNAQPRFLQVDARTALGPFTPLNPRQPITRSPYAISALTSASAASVSGSVPAAQITGTLPLAQLPNAVVTNGASGITLSGTLSGNGAGVTNLDLSLNSGGAIVRSGGFALAAPQSAGSFTTSIAVADLNGDGSPDVTCGSGISGRLLVLTNSGSGDFAVWATPGEDGGRVESVAAADVNGDGRPDLISSRFDTSSLEVWIHNGSGGFTRSSSTPATGVAYSVTAADVNGDERPDLICANYSMDTLTVLTNNGSGGFGVSSAPITGDGPRSVTTADLNNDGKPDLISANYDADTLTVLTNTGSGSFAFASSPTVGNGPYSLAATDVNGDGKPDLVSANYDAGTLTVLTNAGNGSFPLSSSLAVGDGPRHVTSADVNNDGKPDLITANYNANTLTVVTNNGSGGFGRFASPGVADHPIVVASTDVSGDGKPDLLCAHDGFSSLAVLFNATVFNGKIVGDGSGLTAVPPNVALLTGAQTFAGPKTFPTGTLLGNGGSLTNLSATMLAFGTVPDARLSTNVAWLNAVQTFTGAKTFAASTGIVIQAATTAIELRGGGALKVAGAGVNTPTPVFTHRATATNVSGAETRIDHPLCNSHPDAILIVTYNFNPQGGIGTRNDRPVGLYYSSGRWAIYNLDGTAMPVGTAYNVLVFNP